MDLLKSFSFVLPTAIEFGPGVVGRLPEVLGRLGVRRVLLVTDAGVCAQGLTERILAGIAAAGCRHAVHAGVTANPRESDVRAGVTESRALGAQCIVALGGGSPIDCAKAIAVLAVNGGDPRDYAPPGKIPPGVLPVIAVPTTAGSASEVTFSAVLTDSRRKVKFSYRDEKIAPVCALADPEMTVTMPPALTAATGMDALTHAIEAYTARVAEPISDALALQAIELVARHLRTAYLDGRDLVARSGMLMASLLGGLAFSHADVGAAHCIAETLGGRYDLPHGICNAVVLPAVMEHNRAACSERYARVAAAMGLTYDGIEEGARRGVAAVTQLARDLDLPPLRDLGVRAEDISHLAAESARNSSSASNARAMNADDYAALLRELLE